MLFVFLLSGLLLTSVPSAPVPEQDDVVVQDVSSGDAAVLDYNSVSVLADLLTSIDDNLELMAIDTTVNAYQVSDYYKEYFRGVLQNMPYTDYIVYADRVYTDIGTGYNNYITHYYLMYDLKIVNGQVAAGSYPCIDVYSQNSIYYLSEYEKQFEGYPTMGFASFSPYSALIDRSFDFRTFFSVLICFLLFYLISRKSIFN